MNSSNIFFGNLNSIRRVTNYMLNRGFAVKKAEPAIASLGKASKKKLGKFGPIVEKKVLPVETDAHKLVNYVCGSNVLKEGGEDVKIKPDSEYPDWLWKIRTGPAPTLDQLDPNTLEYWLLVRKMGRRRINHLKSVRWLK